MRRGPFKIAGVAATFSVGFVIALHVLPRLPLGPQTAPRLLDIPPFEVPSDSFFVEAAGDDLSQMVLWHGLGNSIENARRADILFVGDSRMPVGLREEIIVPAAAALGLRVFSLACGHVERVRFALELMSFGAPADLVRAAAERGLSGLGDLVEALRQQTEETDRRGRSAEPFLVRVGAASAGAVGDPGRRGGEQPGYALAQQLRLGDGGEMGELPGAILQRRDGLVDLRLFGRRRARGRGAHVERCTASFHCTRPIQHPRDGK